MRASGVVIVSAAALLASVPMCSSLRGSESGRGRSTHVLSAFVPPASRPALAALRFANVMCPRRQHSAEVGRALGGDAGMARFGRSLRGAVASARPARTCVLGVGGGFMEDPDAWGDDDLWEEGSGDGENDWRTVLLKDSKLDRTIECFVDREIEVEGKAYATLMPADTPVIMAGYNTVNGTQQLVPILDDKRIDELFATAAAVLSEMDLCLSRSAVVLTVALHFPRVALCFSLVSCVVFHADLPVSQSLPSCLLSLFLSSSARCVCLLFVFERL